MKRLLTLSCAFIGMLFAKAQTSQPLIQYGFDVIPNSINLNPAFQTEKSIFIGIPVLGGVNLSMFSNELTFSDVIKRESSTRTIVDRDNISKSLTDKSYINTQFSTDILLGGFRAYNGGYWSGGFKLNTELDIRFSNDMMDFLLYGNYNPKVYNRWLDWSEFDGDATVYSEFHVGYSKDLNKRLRVGARLGFLSGLVHVGVTENSLRLKTDENAAIPNTIHTNGVLNYSSAGIDFDAADGTDQVALSPINFSNLGVSLDLGVDYMFNKKLYLSASVVDLGFIRWTDKARKIGVNIPDDWRYEGFTYEPNGDKTLDDEITEWSDNLENDLNLDTTNNSSYTTYLQTKLFLSGKYRLNKKSSVNLTFKGEFDKTNFEPGISLAYQAKLTRFFDIVAGASYLDNQPALGIGFNVSAGPFNWFFMSDNINALTNPRESHGTNFSTGMSLQFSKKKPVKQHGHTRWSENERADKKKLSEKMKKQRAKKKKKELRKKAKEAKRAEKESKSPKKSEKETKSSKKSKKTSNSKKSSKVKKTKKDKQKKSKSAVKNRTKKSKKTNEL